MLADVNRYLTDLSRLPCPQTKRAYSQETIRLYGHYLRRLADWLDQIGVGAEDLTADLLIAYLDDHPGWSEEYRHGIAAAAKSFLRWRYGATHPALSLYVSRSEPSPQRTLNLNQVGDLLSTCNTATPKGRRDLAIISLALDTGLRATELCRLDLDHLYITERHLWARVKGGRWSDRSFTSYTATFLVAWLADRPALARPEIRSVFVSIGGTRPGTSMTREGLRTELRKYGLRSGIGALSTHDLRRTFATLALRLGASTRLVQVAGGWQDIRMVERYSQALDAEDLEPYSPVAAAMRV